VDYAAAAVFVVSGASACTTRLPAPSCR